MILTKKRKIFFFCPRLFCVKLLTRLRLQFSHLNEHKFRHGFSDTVNAMCRCIIELESTEHFLLRFDFSSTQ